RKTNEVAQTLDGSRPKSGKSPAEAENEIGSAERAANYDECRKFSGILVRANGSTSDCFRVGCNRKPDRQRTGAAVALIAFHRRRLPVRAECDISENAVCDFDALARPITRHPNIDTNFHRRASDFLNLGVTCHGVTYAH